MIRFLVDKDFNTDIPRGFRRRVPDIDAPRVQGLGLAGVSDETVLAYAASENRFVLTHDVSALVASAYRRASAERGAIPQLGLGEFSVRIEMRVA